MGKRQRVADWALARAIMGKGSALNTPEFKAAWLDWCEFSHANPKRKGPYTPLAMKGQLRRLEKWGLRRAIEAIGYSLCSDTKKGGWLQIYEPGSSQAVAGPARRQAEPGKYDKANIHRASDG